MFLSNNWTDRDVYRVGFNMTYVECQHLIEATSEQMSRSPVKNGHPIQDEAQRL